jgi:hypothetical protein
MMFRAMLLDASPQKVEACRELLSVLRQQFENLYPAEPARHRSWRRPGPASGYRAGARHGGGNAASPARSRGACRFGSRLTKRDISPPFGNASASSERSFVRPSKASAEEPSPRLNDKGIAAVGTAASRRSGLRDYEIARQPVSWLRKWARRISQQGNPVLAS